MSLSAGWMVGLGAGTSFLPQELLRVLGTAPDETAVLVTQMLGAGYLGFAMMNWMARGNTIGGIYSRPIAVANFFHFTVGAVTLVKDVATKDVPIGVIVAAVVYSGFAVWFGRVLFTHPLDAARGTPGR